MPAATIQQNEQNRATGKTGIRERFSSLDDNVMLIEQEAAEASGFEPTTLKTWRSQGRGPKFHKLGRAVRYRVGDIREWLAAAATVAA
jgi:predicted DNA-binding transcriptional regulator AlpA